MARGFNFCAGPAALPEAVLSRARDEMLDFNQLGMSVMEMSHRSDAFQAVAHAATTDLKTLLSVPDNYKILYMQGGATQQFSCVPWNLLGKNSKADYIDTGIWSTKAINEARRLTGADIHIAGSTQSARYVTVLSSMISPCDLTLPMCITRRMKPLVGSNSPIFPTRKTCRLSPICHPIYCQNPWM